MMMINYGNDDDEKRRVNKKYNYNIYYIYILIMSYGNRGDDRYGDSSSYRGNDDYY